MNTSKINERFLAYLGFIKKKNKFTQKESWAWGMYTEDADKMCKNLNLPLMSKDSLVNISIIEWDEETKIAYASPINYHKEITTAYGMEQFMNAVSFLMSTEH